MDQPTLLSAASVCLDWYKCATDVLYRYPQFASTLHWALFVQTLCRSKGLEQPKARRRRSIEPSLVYTQQLCIQSIPSQIRAVRDQTLQSPYRLITNLGILVRGIDLSSKTVHTEPTKCTCSQPSDSSDGDRNCVLHPETQSLISDLTIHSNALHPAHPTHVGTSCMSEDGGGPSQGDSTEILEDLVTSSWHRNNWPSEDDTGNVVTAPIRQRFSSEGPGHHGGAHSSTLTPYHEANIIWSQRWWILWSMEKQYRQSTCQCHSSPLPSTQWLANTSRNHVDPSNRPRQRSNSVSNLDRRHSVVRSSGSTSMNQGDTPAQTSGRFTAARSKSLIARRNQLNRLVLDRTSPVQTNTVATVTRSSQPLTVTVSSLIQMARHCPNLESLSLGSSLIPDKLYLETGDYQSRLQPGLGDGLTLVPVTVADGAMELGKHCLKLQKLWLAGCDWVTAEEVRLFVTQCRQLQTLDVQNCSRLDSRLGQLFVVDDEEATETLEGDMDDTRDQDESPKDYEYMRWEDEERKRRIKNYTSEMMMEEGMKTTTTITTTTTTTTATTITTAEAEAVIETHSSTGSNSSSSSLSMPRISFVVSSGPTKRVRDGAMYDLVNAACSGGLEAMSTRRQQPPQPQPETAEQIITGLQDLSELEDLDDSQSSIPILDNPLQAELYDVVLENDVGIVMQDIADQPSESSDQQLQRG
ncbi:hypothetical protein BGZ65_008948, partial [Modicella reniformis]